MKRRGLRPWNQKKKNVRYGIKYGKKPYSKVFKGGKGIPKERYRPARIRVRCRVLERGGGVI